MPAGLAGLLTQWIGAARGILLLSSALLIMALFTTLNRELRGAT